MQFPKSAKIESALPKHDVRAYLNHAFLDASDPQKPVLVATDGHMLAVVPVSLDDGDTSGFVTADAIKAARKVKRGSRHNHYDLTANGTLSVPGVAQFPRPSVEELGNYPDYRRLLCAPTGKPDITINAGQLKALADAIGADRGVVSLTFSRNEDGSIDDMSRFTVTGVKTNATGVLMPVRG